MQAALEQIALAEREVERERHQRAERDRVAKQLEFEVSFTVCCESPAPVTRHALQSGAATRVFLASIQPAFR